MSKWKIYSTASDGRKSYIKADDNAWARIWEHPGKFFWSVYVGDGNNEVASGKSTSLMLAKIAANVSLKTAGATNGQ